MTSLGTMEQNPSRQGRYTRQAKGAAEARAEHWRHGLAAKQHLAEAPSSSLAREGDENVAGLWLGCAHLLCSHER